MGEKGLEFLLQLRIVRLKNLGFLGLLRELLYFFLELPIFRVQVKNFIRDFPNVDLVFFLDALELVLNLLLQVLELLVDLLILVTPRLPLLREGLFLGLQFELLFPPETGDLFCELLLFDSLLFYLVLQ